jgi:hypothetical protein
MYGMVGGHTNVYRILVTVLMVRVDLGVTGIDKKILLK